MSESHFVSASVARDLLADLLYLLREAPLGMPLCGFAREGELTAPTMEVGREILGTEFRRVERGALHDRLRDGYTLVVNGFDLLSRRAAMAASRDLGISDLASCNAYVSGAGASTAFGPHSDDRDQIILQLWGAKHWEIGERETGRPSESVVLTRGMWVPIEAGLMHRVETRSQVSAHLTFARRR